MTAGLSPVKVCGFHGHLSLGTMPAPGLSWWKGDQLDQVTLSDTQSLAAQGNGPPGARKIESLEKKPSDSLGRVAAISPLTCTTGCILGAPSQEWVLGKCK